MNLARDIEACARTLLNVAEAMESPSDGEGESKAARYVDEAYIKPSRLADGEKLTHRLTNIQKRISVTHESLMMLMERLGMVLLPDSGEASPNGGEDSPVTSDLGRELNYIGARIEGLNATVQHILERVDI